MLILNSIPKQRIWGTDRLKEYSTDKSINKIGSVYSAAAIEEINNSILGNINNSFREEVKKNPEAFGLLKNEDYPLIVSITGADEDLSIQVHPTDDYAQKKEAKPYGKSEAWFFVNQPNQKAIIAGQKTKSKKNILSSIENNDISHILNYENIEKEQIIYIPSGTIHALTKGSIVYEVQQSTDITYRFYDYDRVDIDGNTRDLHQKEALETLILSQNVSKYSCNINDILEFREFKLQRIIMDNTYTNIEKIAQVVTILSGNLFVDGDEIAKGQSMIVFPGETIKMRLRAECMIATPKIYWRDAI